LTTPAVDATIRRMPDTPFIDDPAAAAAAVQPMPSRLVPEPSVAEQAERKEPT
jgi:hypothetical protein